MRSTITVLTVCGISLLSGCSPVGTSEAKESTASTSATRTPKTNPAPAIAASKLEPTEIAQKMGFALYPGATIPDNESTAPLTDTAGDLRLELVQHSSDSVDQVTAHYEQLLGFTAVADGARRSLIGKAENGSDLILLIESVSGKTKIRANAIVYQAEG